MSAMMTRIKERAQRHFVPLAAWALVTVVASMAGPFGTFEALAAPARVLYWAAVVAAAILLSRLVRDWYRGKALRRRLFGRAGFALGLGTLLFALNAALFDGMGTPRHWLFLVLAVAVVDGLIDAMLYLMRHSFAGPDAENSRAAEAAARFLRRLPIDRRGPLIRLEAQDHYLKVVTERGAEMILMRMGDAEEELRALGGVRVHRSHWVNPPAVTRHQRAEGRDVLQMRDGYDVPVSRSYRKAALEAGLIAKSA